MGARRAKGIPRILPSKVRNPFPNTPTTSAGELPDDPFAEKNEADNIKRGPEEEQMLERMKAGANVRFFEQDYAGNRRELSSVQEFSMALDGKSEIRDAIKKDPKQLFELAEGASLEEDEDEMWESLDPEVKDELLSGENIEQIRADLEMEYQKGLAEGKTIKQIRAKMREELRENLEHYLEETNQEHLLEPMPLPRIDELAWPKSPQRKLILSLNGAILGVRNRVERGKPLSEDHIRPVWKRYFGARQTLALKWNAVPEEVWAFLWATFSMDDPVNNPKRSGHISLLAKDMSAAGISLTSSQQILTIESLFLTNFEADAMKNWKRCIPTLGADTSESFTEFWELGARLFCRLGDVEQASRAVDKLLDTGSDPRIIMPLIAAYTNKNTEEDFRMAWAYYKRLKVCLGQDMKIEDYDQIVSNFLAANRTEDALRVFVDMMTSGKVEVMTNRRLPLVIGNKFFFGKWLKRLIGAGELTGAQNVLTFMLQRSVQPSPIQVNGLIGALYRTGLANQVQKADELGWEMIKSRLDFVVARREGKGTRRQVDLLKPVAYPPATLETFCILAENYRVRGIRKAMDQLMDAFAMAEIESDAFLMNQLLENHLQYGEHDAALQLYRDLVPTGQIQPNPYTFMALWKVLFVNRANILEDDFEPETRKARSTFAEMMRFIHVFEERQIDDQLARKVLHTFRRLRDPHGLIVALKAMHQVFGYLPNETIALELTVGTVNLNLDSSKLSFKVRNKLREQKKAMDLDILRRLREKALELPDEKRSQSTRLEDLASDMDDHDRGLVLLEYLVGFYTPKRDPEVSELVDDLKLFEHAAEEMGVYDEGEEMNHDVEVAHEAESRNGGGLFG